MTCLTIILCASSRLELLTALLEYLDLLQGVAVPLPSRLLHLCDCDYELYNIMGLANPIAPHTPLTYLLSEKKMLCYQLCSCSRMNQLLFKKNFCNQSSHYENYGWFNGSHHVSTTKSTLFVANKDEWCTKEGCAKSMKKALYVQRYGKRHLLGWKRCQTAKKSSPYP